MENHRFLADGRDRALNAPDLQADLAASVAEIRARYDAAMAAAPWYRRLVLRYRLNREIRAEIERRAPSDALYLIAEATGPRKPAA